jgi:hypothetical protein
LALATAQRAFGQSLLRFAQLPWTGKDISSTYDNPIFEPTGHVSGSNNDERVQWWDSYGRVRIDKNNPDSVFFGYRVLTSDLNSDSTVVRSTMDEFDLTVGVHWGQIADWRISSIAGVGYSSTHPFVNEKGLFGIGSITAEHPVGDTDAILLAVDYSGNAGLLPDVPLPGFAWMHHDEHLYWMAGYPVNRVEWRPGSHVIVTADYQVPYTGGVEAEWLPWEHFGFYGKATNWMQGIVIAKEDSIDRQFFQIRRAEVGLRVIFNPLVDAGIGVGYAFDQTLSEGYDVRSLRGLAHLSNEPYLSVVIHGRI